MATALVVKSHLDTVIPQTLLDQARGLEIVTMLAHGLPFDEIKKGVDNSEAWVVILPETDVCSEEFAKSGLESLPVKFVFDDGMNYDTSNFINSGRAAALYN